MPQQPTSHRTAQEQAQLHSIFHPRPAPPTPSLHPTSLCLSPERARPFERAKSALSAMSTSQSAGSSGSSRASSSREGVRGKRGVSELSGVAERETVEDSDEGTASAKKATNTATKTRRRRHIHQSDSDSELVTRSLLPPSTANHRPPARGEKLSTGSTSERTPPTLGSSVVGQAPTSAFAIPSTVRRKRHHVSPTDKGISRDHTRKVAMRKPPPARQQLSPVSMRSTTTASSVEVRAVPAQISQPVKSEPKGKDLETEDDFEIPDSPEAQRDLTKMSSPSLPLHPPPKVTGARAYKHELPSATSSDDDNSDFHSNRRREPKKEIYLRSRTHPSPNATGSAPSHARTASAREAAKVSAPPSASVRSASTTGSPRKKRTVEVIVPVKRSRMVSASPARPAPLMVRPTGIPKAVLVAVRKPRDRKGLELDSFDDSDEEDDDPASPRTVPSSEATSPAFVRTRGRHVLVNVQEEGSASESSSDSDSSDLAALLARAAARRAEGTALAPAPLAATSPGDKRRSTRLPLNEDKKRQEERMERLEKVEREKDAQQARVDRFFREQERERAKRERDRDGLYEEGMRLAAAESDEDSDLSEFEPEALLAAKRIDNARVLANLVDHSHHDGFTVEEGAMEIMGSQEQRQVKSRAKLITSTVQAEMVRIQSQDRFVDRDRDRRVWRDVEVRAWEWDNELAEPFGAAGGEVESAWFTHAREAIVGAAEGRAPDGLPWAAGWLGPLAEVGSEAERRAVVKNLFALVTHPDTDADTAERAHDLLLRLVSWKPVLGRQSKKCLVRWTDVEGLLTAFGLKIEATHVVREEPRARAEDTSDDGDQLPPPGMKLESLFKEEVEPPVEPGKLLSVSKRTAALRRFGALLAELVESRADALVDPLRWSMILTRIGLDPGSGAASSEVAQARDVILETVPRSDRLQFRAELYNELIHEYCLKEELGGVKLTAPRRAWVQYLVVRDLALARSETGRCVGRWFAWGCLAAREEATSLGENSSALEGDPPLSAWLAVLTLRSSPTHPTAINPSPQGNAEELLYRSKALFLALVGAMDDLWFGVETGEEDELVKERRRVARGEVRDLGRALQAIEESIRTDIRGGDPTRHEAKNNFMRLWLTLNYMLIEASGGKMSVDGRPMAFLDEGVGEVVTGGPRKSGGRRSVGRERGQIVWDFRVPKVKAEREG